MEGRPLSNDFDPPCTRELSDAEWDDEIRTALVAFRRARWEEKKARRNVDPWVL
jgi:hypothetical protein